MRYRNPLPVCVMEACLREVVWTTQFEYVAAAASDFQILSSVLVLGMKYDV